MKKTIFILIISTCYIGCKVDDYYRHFDADNISEKKIQIETVLLDSIILDSVNTSHVGFVSIQQDSIFFIDQILCKVFSFGYNGEAFSEHLGIGRGPGEFTHDYIETYCKLPNGDHLFIGSSFDVHLFNQNWERLKRLTMDWQSSVRDVHPVNPSPEEHFMLYTMEYTKFIVRPTSNNEVILPIFSQHQYFNPWTKRYYKEGRIMALLDLESGKVTKIFGRRSPEYLNFEFVGHHSFFSFDIDSNDNIYIAHEIDSLIYVYDNDHNPLYTFGFSGKNMDTGYQEFANFSMEHLMKLYNEDRPARGWYNEIEYFEDHDILFRSYKKGAHSQNDGLQIYQNNVLIGDINVPKDFTVKGYIEPYFYSGAFIDVQIGEIKLYRFELPSVIN